MKIPFEEVLCIIAGYLVTAGIGYAFSQFIKKHNLNLGRLIGRLPDWIGGVLALILILLVAPFVCFCFTWGFVAWEYLKSGEFGLAATTFAVNIFGCFYMSVVTEGLPRWRRRR